MATFDEVKDLPNHPEIYLIDVRSKDELTSTGAIPCGINIPLQDLGQAFEMSDNDFKTLYNRPKPSKDAPIIFSCLRGGRAQKAADLALAHGFKSVKPYLGSWTEWAQNQGV